MSFLQTIGDIGGTLFGGIGKKVERALTSVFGSSNARTIKKLQPKVAAINELEPKYQAMTDTELREQTAKFRERLAAGETLDDILVEAFAVCREGGRRFLNMRHYDTQLIGGMVLHGGSIAEMVTGEGKTLVATLPAYLNAIEGKGVHVVTVNDYLARRDMEWMGPLYMQLGLTVGAIQSDMEPPDRQNAYDCDITYGTNNEFGFDYLRDNMRSVARGDDHFPRSHQQSQGRLNFAIIDEVDNILVDEARTPLIISGPAFQDVGKYADADRIARQLKKELHFTVNEKDHQVQMTEEGVREAEKLAGVESFYTAGNMEWPHLMDNALKAHHLYKRDVNYVNKEGKIIIVDEFTGRLMDGRQWSDGLHQAVEAKEGVKIKEETQTLATITLQNFFKLYNKISGMTGTAMTEANEFWKIYKLDVIAIPTNRSMQRVEHADLIYLTEHAKFTSLADEIEKLNRWDILNLKDKTELLGEIVKEDETSVTFTPQGSKQKDVIPREKITEIHRRGRPILVGTVSIEKSEQLSDLLTRRGVKHEVLNAKHHKREAEIIAQAGRLGAVTIATNMAGRGTDIILGGNPEALAWARLQDKYATRLEIPKAEWDAVVNEIEAAEHMKEEGKLVKSLGGLHVIGTERHEARRIDLQLRGRCGRQGDPGSSRFFLSLEDDLMRIFAGPWVKSFLERMGMKQDEAIESPMVTRRIEGAQKKVEERNFEIRKNLLEYDEVMDEQRKRVYGYRQQILDGANCKNLVFDMVEQQVDKQLDEYLQPTFGTESFAKWASGKLGVTLDPRDYRGLDYAAASQEATDEALRAVETQVHEVLDENLPAEDETEWNWEALARTANTRWNADVRDRDLKKLPPAEVSELLLAKARESVAKIDLSEGEQFLKENYGLLSACAWVRNKFGIQIELDNVRQMSADAFKEHVIQQAKAAYNEREIEFPVIAGLQEFGASKERLDRDGLIAWARGRFSTNLDLEDLKTKQREEIYAVLLEKSRQFQQGTEAALAAASEQVNRLFSNADASQTVGQITRGNGSLSGLTNWAKQTLQVDLPVESLLKLKRDELERKLQTAVAERYRPEMRRMERGVLLQIVDTAWKDHLLAMDHLRSGVGLVGYAQVDAKVEYKRQGMRMFETMWQSIGERATDLVFRMEQLDEDFIGSTMPKGTAVHGSVESVSDLARQQENQQFSGGETNQQVERRLEPIRNRGAKVGRNDPCPCGSGKKYKACCMRKEEIV